MIGPLSAPGEGARLCFSIMGLTGWDWVCWQAHSFPLPFVPPCIRRAALRYILGRLARAHGIPRDVPDGYVLPSLYCTTPDSRAYKLLDGRGGHIPA